MWANGTSVINTTDANTGPTSNNDSQSIAIGANTTLADYFNGDIAELIVYPAR